MNFIEKITAFACMGGWTVAAGIGSTTAMLEPVTGSLIAGGAILAHLAQGRRSTCEAALKRVRMKSEKGFRQWAKSEAIDKTVIDKSLAEFDKYLERTRPSLEDIAEWRLNEKTIAKEMLKRLSARSAYIKAEPIARRIAREIVEQTFRVVKDDPEFFANAEPAIARQLLKDFEVAHDQLERIRRTGEETQADVKEVKSTVTKLYELLGPEAREVQRKFDLTDEALESFFETLGQRAVPPEKLILALNDIATHYNNLLDRQESLSNEASEIAELKRQAHEAIKRVDLDEAETLLARAEDLALTAIERREERAREEAEAIKHERRQAAATRAQRGEIALTRLDYFAAADHFAAAANMASADDAETRWRYLMREISALIDHGELFPGLDALRRAARVGDNALQSAPLEIRPEDCAATQNYLGIVLLALGERAGSEEGVNALNGSVEAYRAALVVHTRDAMPAQWATTQNNLGTVLSTLGERAGGEEGINALNGAEEAYGAALEVRTRNAMPAQWAMTQNNLGAALRTLGGRVGGKEGVNALNGSVEAYRAAFEVFTRDAMPFMWAQTRENLAIALLALGQRKKDNGMLQQALDAAEGALEVYEEGSATFYIEKATRLRDRILEAMK